MIYPSSSELVIFWQLICLQGGDGFFNEILNGFLSSRHKAPYPPTPSDFLDSTSRNDSLLLHDPSETVIEASSQNNEQSPLISSSGYNSSEVSNISKYENKIFPYKSKFEFDSLL